ncbi:MAG: hypothetical protein ACMUHM_02850 [Thermoplasmatota archaeon]
MKGLRLSDRTLGSEFCRFERSLIFEEDLKDVGFVSHLGSRTFRLVKSRFTDLDSGRTYVLPPDGSVSVDEGAFVRVEVDRLVPDRRLGDPGKERGLIGIQTTYAEVASVSEARVPLPPPGLPVDEFLDRISLPWRNAEEDHLHQIIGLLMVSSPRSIFGEGGLGSEGVHRERSVLKGSNRDLANSILGQLPVEFRTGGTAQYKYSKIEGVGDIKLIQSKKVSENCYSLVPERVHESMVERRIPIQLPFVIRNSELVERDIAVDLDVLDYQLSGLYLPPPPEKVQEETLTEVMKRLHKEEFWDMNSIGEIEPTAGPKLSLALTRLFIGRSFDGKGYRASRTDPTEGIEIIRSILRYGFENIRLKLKEESYFRSRRSEPWRGRLRSLDKEIYIDLRSRFEENGIEEVPRDKLMPGVNTYRIDESLERLSKYGYVLLLKGGAVIKIMRSYEPSDEN